jgi:hypothetical protein
MPETGKVYLSKIAKGLAIKLMLNHELNRIIMSNKYEDIGENFEHLEEKDIKHLARYFESLNDNTVVALRSECTKAYKDMVWSSTDRAAYTPCTSRPPVVVNMWSWAARGRAYISTSM